MLVLSAVKMLAGPRRRQKISVDPRNKQWSEDKNQFGRRLMEKMGWSHGKGLGVNEDGETKNIKVTVKNNNKGLGFNRDEGDNWLGHQDGFNDLLSQLHQEHSQEETAADPPKSIEEKSKNSRRRVHYKKFTRGKDLANRSADDMNCIFGRRSGSSTPQTTSEPASGDEREGSVTPVHGIKTIVNSVSIQDYFAQKMAEMKGNMHSDSQVKGDSHLEGESPKDGNSPNQVDHPSLNGDIHRKPKKKCKKRKRKLEERASFENEGIDAVHEDEGLVGLRTTSDRGEEEGDERGETGGIEGNTEWLEEQRNVEGSGGETGGKRKKKKKKRTKGVE